MEKLNIRDSVTVFQNIPSTGNNRATPPKLSNDVHVRGSPCIEEVRSGSKNFSQHENDHSIAQRSGNRKKPSKVSMKKKNSSMADTSLLNFHFERPVAVTQSYGSTRHQNFPTLSERRNKARHSLLSKETYLQAK